MTLDRAIVQSICVNQGRVDTDRGMALCFIGLFDAILTLINASPSSVIYGEGTIMPRAPFQVLVYPYHRVGENDFVYALFKRSDAGYWQAIAGGGEDNETPLEAAKRETFEEAGIARESDFIQLDTIESVPVTEFSNSHLWGNELYVIPQYCFGVLTKEEAIVLSHEHSEYRWLTYQEAAAMVKFDGNRTALWELDRRLRGKGPRG